MKNWIANINWPGSQVFVFSLLRIGIGWHFLWEGWIKLSQPSWSAENYLLASWGPFSSLFQGMTSLTVSQTPILNWFFTSNTQWILAISNFAVPWLLFLAGIELILGLFSRAAILAAMGLLVLFIIAMPSIDMTPTLPEVNQIGWSQYYTDMSQAQWAGKMKAGHEGNYFLINKNIIEFLALASLLTIDLRKLYGIDSLLEKTPEKSPQENETTETMPQSIETMRTT